MKFEFIVLSVSLLFTKYDGTATAFLSISSSSSRGTPWVQDPLLTSSLLKNNPADDLFDPLLSPHAYPNGIDAGPVLSKENNNQNSNNNNYQKKKAFGFRTNNSRNPSESSIPLRPSTMNTTPSVFDPTLSPHMYPNGTPNQVELASGTTTTTSSSSTPTPSKIGILLMDHGSRNPNSNQRLQTLAELYQNQLLVSSTTTTTIVRAAHMEIAEPSIPQILRQLILEDQVDQIICHPYFLSPGRHVTQDIPQIIQQAIEDIRMELRTTTNQELPPIVTTDPVGAQTDIMIAAIHNLVQQSANVPLNR